MSFVLSANRLDDGSVVYFTDDEQWSNQVEDAKVVSDQELDEVLRIGRRAEGQNIVVGCCEVEVGSNTPILPVRLRERIRSHGPTVGDHQSRPIGGPEG
ncbi:MAG: DUF2849 domain-containing protein [Alphaproteobacteria bacterium]|nr:DUF2849 domain-containing protein [Alphaproteobacteria bacterium]